MLKAPKINSFTPSRDEKKVANRLIVQKTNYLFKIIILLFYDLFANEFDIIMKLKENNKLWLLIILNMVGARKLKVKFNIILNMG